MASKKMEELIAIPGISKLWLMPPGSQWILIRELFFLGDVWEVHVYTSGFVSAHRVCVVVSAARRRRSAASGVNVSIEILDDTWERTVFHEESVGRASLELDRTDLEVTSCVDHNDNIPVRCTLSFLGTTNKYQNTSSFSKWWRQLRRNLLPPKKMSNSSSHLSDREATTTAMTLDRAAAPPPTARHLITVPGYSKLARMPGSTSLTLRMFRFNGHTWSITLRPDSSDSICIIAMRRTECTAQDSGIDTAIEILDKSRKHALFCKKKQAVGDDGRWFISWLRVKTTELEAAPCLDEEDSFTIACTLTFLDTKQQQHQQQQDEEKIIRTTITDESDSVYTPLLRDQKLLNF